MTSHQTIPSVASTTFVTSQGFKALYPGLNNNFILLDDSTNGRIGRVVCIDIGVGKTQPSYEPVYGNGGL